MPDPCSFRPDEIPWDPVSADGTATATLAGTRDGGVQFTYGFFIPAGFWDAPHSHCADAHVFVMSGELRLGYGVDRSRAQAFPAGSFLYVPAGMVHVDGAEVDTVILGNAVGPWSTDYV